MGAIRGDCAVLTSVWIYRVIRYKKADAGATLPLCALTSTEKYRVNLTLSTISHLYNSSMSAATDQAGPSRPKRAGTSRSFSPVVDDDEDSPRAALSSTQPSGSLGAAQDEEEDEDEQVVDFDTIQSFASKIQHQPDEDGAPSRPKITIPKRGEKDFEPLAETVNLQEMMLQRSREALFNALVGVRGGHSKSMSHALLVPGTSFPRILVARGHLQMTLGMTVRSFENGKGKSRVELLPEEALYLLERGSLQIWVGPVPMTEEEEADRLGEWVDEEQGVRGATELSAMEGYGVFLGKEGLTWERYQAYAYLKRLGYTVQRVRRFIPPHFLHSSNSARTPVNLLAQDGSLPPFRTWWFSIPRWIGGMGWGLCLGAQRLLAEVFATIGQAARSVLPRGDRRFLKGTLLDGWYSKTYASLFAHLRMTPSSHSAPLPVRAISFDSASPYSILDCNPYLPFFHVWKPATAWSKAKWDKGSAAGLATQKPDFFIAAVEARNTPMPSIHQLKEAWDEVMDEPKGPIRRLGPQYENRRPPPRSYTVDKGKRPWWGKWLPSSWSNDPRRSGGSTGGNIGALRNGDRALIVAVNDSGNTGWLRFGRTGFAEQAMI